MICKSKNCRQLASAPLIWILMIGMVGCDYARLAVSLSSDAVSATLQDQSWHEKNGWVAEKFFSDPQVIQLCKAIEANDLVAIKLAIDGGVDVNALGKDNMTPLLWALPENHPERMKILLKTGANPNVFIKSNMGVFGMFQPGDSVTHMASRSVFDYFDIVFDHGGDPNLPSETDGNPPIFAVIQAGHPTNEEKKRRIKKLVEMGADINFPGSESMGGGPPLCLAARFGAQYDLTSYLLDLGAIPRTYDERGMTTVAHTLAAEMMSPNSLLPITSERHRQQFEALVAKLLKMGVDVEDAKLDQLRRTNLGVKMKELQEREIVFVSVADAFMLRNGVPRLPRHADQFLKDFETKIGKRFDEYTIYKWVELELLDDQGKRVAFDRPGDHTYPKKKMDRFHSDLVAVRWTEKGQFSDAVFIKIKPDAIAFPRILENARTVPSFRVASDRVGSSASISGYKNRDVLPTGTIFDKASWIAITTNEKATEIVSVKELPKLPFVPPPNEPEPPPPKPDPPARKLEEWDSIRLDFGWQAEDYFDDQQSLEFCRAIESRDFKRIDQLLSQGIDINKKGKHGMTFLWWSFPIKGKDKDYNRVAAYLLERGADPNMKIESDIVQKNSEPGLQKGDSVMSQSPIYGMETFQLILKHGGDPNIVDGSGMTPMHNALKFGNPLETKTHLKLLLDHGADIDGKNSDGETPAMYAIRWYGQYDLVLFLLDSGASHQVENPNTKQRLIHYAVAEASKKGRFGKYKSGSNIQVTMSDKATYDRLLKFLVDKGESIKDAVAENEKLKNK